MILVIRLVWNLDRKLLTLEGNRSNCKYGIRPDKKDSGLNCFILSIKLDSALTDTLDSLAHRRNVFALSLFYRYYLGISSDEIKSTIPPKASFERNTQFFKIQQSLNWTLTKQTHSLIRLSLWLLETETRFLCAFSRLHITFQDPHHQIPDPIHEIWNPFFFSQYKGPPRTT